MPVNQLEAMPLGEFYRLRTKYERLARERFEQRLNHGDQDTPWPQRVLEEMMMDFHLRLAEIEKLLDVGPDLGSD